MITFAFVFFRDKLLDDLLLRLFCSRLLGRINLLRRRDLRFLGLYRGFPFFNLEVVEFNCRTLAIWMRHTAVVKRSSIPASFGLQSKISILFLSTLQKLRSLNVFHFAVGCVALLRPIMDIGKSFFLKLFIERVVECQHFALVFNGELVLLFGGGGDGEGIFGNEFVLGLQLSQLADRQSDLALRLPLLAEADVVCK